MTEWEQRVDWVGQHWVRHLSCGSTLLVTEKGRAGFAWSRYHKAYVEREDGFLSVAEAQRAADQAVAS